MKNTFLAIVILTVLSFSSFRMLCAAAPAGLSPESGAMIGYCDFNRALNEVADGKKAKQRLKDEFREKQEQLDRLQSELAATKESIDRDRLILSSQEIGKREEQYRRKYAELQLKLDGFKRDIAVKESELTGEILASMRSIVKEIGNTEGYSLILEKSQEVVLYAPDGRDLTDRVIAAYDRQRGSRKK